MPLNTFSKTIDYGSYMLPIKNSALTINIWFCAPFDDDSEPMEIDPESSMFVNMKKYLQKHGHGLKHTACHNVYNKSDK